MASKLAMVTTLVSTVVCKMRQWKPGPLFFS